MSTARARSNAIGAMILRAPDPRTRFLVSMRRARSLALDGEPLTIDLADPGRLASVAVRGWLHGGNSGSWTLGHHAQLLIVPREPPRGAARIVFDISAAMHGSTSAAAEFGISVNGGDEHIWLFDRANPAGGERSIDVPARMVEQLGAFLITVRISDPRILPGAKGEFRALGLAIRRITVLPVDAER